jgi:iron complex outermembrane receptor protein
VDLFTHFSMHSPAEQLRRLALVTTFGSCALSAFAQSAPNMLEPVFVTASRFEPDQQLPAIGASVITATQIREAGASSVGDALTRIGGVVTRNGGAAERSIDLRGFGSLSSDNNIVVMVDGVRLSENEQAAAVLSSVPIENVERIEIIRGGSSVLYGDGATGGIVRVITKRPQANKAWGSVSAGLGSFYSHDLRLSAGRDWNGLSLDASIQNQRSAGWRENSATGLESFTGTLQYRIDGGRIGLRVDHSNQDNRLPGPLSRTAFEANPRSTVNPNDFGNSELTRYTLFGERRIGAWELAFDLAQREKTVLGNFASLGSIQQDDSRVTQFSPRLRHLHKVGKVHNELSLGIDYQQWSRNSNRSNAFVPSAARATQDALALYIRDDLRIGAWRFAAGVRQESFDKDFNDPLGPVSGSVSAYRIKQNLRAWDLQAAYALQKGLEVFAKAGQSYRLPNVDDNGSTLIVNQPLLPQTSHDLELGVELGDQRQRLTAKVFQHKVRNEIMFNPLSGLFGTNVNIPATRRRGFEVEGKVALPASTYATLNWQHINATITEGANAGNQLVVVPRNTASLRMNWLPLGPHSASAGLVYVGAQRFGGDFSNSCSAMIPAYAALDARYAWKRNGWEVSVAGTNLADRHYYSYAFSFNCGTSVYPENGRAVTLRVRRDF